MLIVGINAFHPDSAACIVRDGVVVAAVEEERLVRIKHWAGFPAEALRFCLRECRASLADVDVVAVNADPRAGLARKLWHLARGRSGPRAIRARIRARAERASIRVHLDAFSGAGHPRVVPVEHHLAHLASAYFTSGFEDSAVLSIDGFGDFASAAWGLGSGSRVEVRGRIWFPHSLGVFYEAATQYLGFERFGDEYKVMGLAAHGQPRWLHEMGEIVALDPDGRYRLNLGCFRHHVEALEHRWQAGEPRSAALFSDAWGGLLGPPRAPDAPIETRHRDIAASVQRMFETALFHLVDGQVARAGSRSLALAGGCAFNSVANGRLHASGRFEQMHVQPAAGDAGGAVGAALAVWYQARPAAPLSAWPHAYLGPALDPAGADAALDERSGDLARAGCVVERVERENALVERVAAAIDGGAVVGWVQGRSEWGPRALGNRSILCDPRRDDAPDLLNRKIKRRESFRPFAPAVLRSRAAEWFDHATDVPYMTHVLPVRTDRRARIPAVTHVDGSGRLQTVTEQSNRLFHRLITAFEARTGVPMLLNTSFNENEPIVCDAAEALDCFLRTSMDMLVLGDRIVERVGAA